MQAAAAPLMAGAPPGVNNTLFVNNISEKIKKKEIQSGLLGVFGQFGAILAVHVNRHWSSRGQAWIVFKDLGAASAAITKMQGFPFFDKQLRIQFANARSDKSLKAEGTFDEAAAMQRSRKRQAELRAEKKGDHKKAKKQSEKDKAAAREAANMQIAPAAVTPAPDNTPAQPNNILFVENLPNECNEFMLSMLFQQFGGFREVRLVPGKPGIGFVEFENEMQSTIACNSLQNFRITPSNLMQISFARK
eukprot:gnl/Hemi2/5756_TR1980_c0_g2_i1.p2 gnl/Hemi2/5756_TR1980_c0_g2~~gnl/Hemi2/5756_TR1980_c0_g2_i1.p2  ORF type:complete len:248 (+),score=92.06 gnl/Hemi2/5756_TR1980_c0_g2_i1:57-800(+)